MAIEQFANNAATTLNGGITSVATTLVVASASGFPSTGNFRILIDSEYMLVTGVSGTTFTVTRGVDGSTMASHLTAATVTCILTRDALGAFRSDGIATGAYGSTPAAGAAGRIYLSNDGPYLQRDTGSVWAAFGPLLPLTPPVLGNYTWNNQGFATATVMGGGIAMVAPAGGSESINLLYKSVPSAPYTLTMGFIPCNFGANFNRCGMALRESSSGKLVTFSIVGYQADNSPPNTVAVVEKYSSSTTQNANYNFLHGNSLLALATGGPMIFFRIYDDNTQRHWYISFDGIVFVEVANQSRTDYITPDQIGFFVNANAGALSIGVSMNVIHWL